MHMPTSGSWFTVEHQGLTLPQARYVIVHVNSDIRLVHVPALSLAARQPQLAHAHKSQVTLLSNPHQNTHNSYKVRPPLSVRNIPAKGGCVYLCTQVFFLELPVSNCNPSKKVSPSVHSFVYSNAPSLHILLNKGSLLWKLMDHLILFYFLFLFFLLF